MFNVPLNARLPGFRVGLPEDPPGFAMNQDGSARGSFADSSAPGSGYDFYGNALQTTALPIAFNSAAIDPTRQATVGSPWTNQSPLDASAEQWAAATTCAGAHTACIQSGRPPIDCLRALYKCSQDGVPTIFAPGIWGRPT